MSLVIYMLPDDLASQGPLDPASGACGDHFGASGGRWGLPASSLRPLGHLLGHFGAPQKTSRAPSAFVLDHVGSLWGHQGTKFHPLV